MPKQYKCSARLPAELVLNFDMLEVKNPREAREHVLDMLDTDTGEDSVKSDFKKVIEDFKDRYDDVSAWDIKCKLMA